MQKRIRRVLSAFGNGFLGIGYTLLLPLVILVAVLVTLGLTVIFTRFF